MSQAPNSAGLTSSQMEQLCQPEQLERTLHLLFNMNHWAKARERLFFPDRQGLYQVKAAILRQAHAVGAIEASAYIDGTEGFGKDITLDIAADLVAEVVTERLARATRQPIPCSELTALCVAPTDLLFIQDRRFYYLEGWDSWDSLDASDLRKLDPEGLSLVAFRYTSPIAHYVFHLPFRLAEAFLSTQWVHELMNAPATSREFAEYYGRSITESESLQHPVEEILRELGVDITTICPRQLSNKQEYTLAKASRYDEWDEDWSYHDEDEELDDEVWNGEFTPENKKQSQQVPMLLETEYCPLCHTRVNTPGTPRIDHWRQAHPGQDLTISQASWILNRSTNRDQFCTDMPPDYRVPIEGVKGKGTRYWKLETLEIKARGWSVEEEI